jgi:N4-gp56 family major capsid protein
MAATITDDATILTKPVNAVFQQTFLRRAQQTCPYFTGTQPGTLTKQAGTSTIKWRRIEQLAPSTSALAELTGAATFMMGRSSVTPTFTDVIATVSKYGQFYIINEEVDLYNPNGTANELVGTLGESAGRSLNQLMRNIAEGSTTQRYANNVASLAAVHAKVATNDLARAVNELSNNSARTFTALTAGSTNIGTSPILASYWAFCHPDVAYDVTTLTGFSGIEKYNSQVQTAPGEFGYMPGAGRGIRFIQSEDASKTANAGAALSGADLNSTGGTKADTYAIVILGQDALGSVGLGMRHTDGTYMAGDNTGGWDLINHPRGSGGIADPFNEIATIAYKLFFTGAVLNANWARSINVAATNLAN